MKDLKKFKVENGLYGLKDEDGNVVKEPFAVILWKDGRFMFNSKWGIIDFKTGKILKEPFAYEIYNDGRFEVNGKYGLLNLKTGEITKEAV